MTLLDDAIVLATTKHAGQVDKQGQPYILHPLRVMLAQTNDDARIVAVLHDVVEDTDCTIDELFARGFARYVPAIKILTRDKVTRYEDYIDRIAHAGGPVVDIKLADLRDNLSRLNGLSKADQDRLFPRYRDAVWRLMSPPMEYFPRDFKGL